MKRFTNILVPGLLFALLVVSPFLSSAANAQTKLRWKFKVGEKLNYTMVQKMNMSMMVQGQNIEMKMTQTMDMVWKAKSTSKDGTTELAQTFTRIRFTLAGGPIGKVDYDSNTPNAGGGNPLLAGLGKTFGALVNQEFTMKMSALGEIKDIKLPKKFLDTLGNAGGAGRVPGMLNADTLKEMVGKAGIVFPATGVVKGKTWNSNMTVKNPFGDIKIATAYQHLGLENRNGQSFAKIKVTPKMTLTAKPNAPFKIQLAKQEGSGTVLFDVKAGRVQSSSMKQKMVMEINAGGQNISQTIDQTVEMKLGKSSGTK